MNCPKCKLENEDGALFCKHCGSKLIVETTNGKDYSSPLLFTYIIVVTIFYIINKLITTFSTDWYSSEGGFISILYKCTTTIECLCFIMIPLAIKNRTLKIIALVITVPLILFWLYSNIQWMLSSYRLN